MIGRLRGKLIVKRAPQLLVDVNGVGYEVEAPMSTFYRLPEPGAALAAPSPRVLRERVRGFTCAMSMRTGSSG